MTALKLLVISTLLEEVVYFLAVGFHEVNRLDCGKKT
jgi:hypothetical protein